MKKLIKSLIKILFVIILPVVYSIICYHWIVSENLVLPVLAMIIIGILIIANAVFYYSFMSNTKMFRGVIVEFTPVIGLALGFDRAYYTHKLIVLLPFTVIEITTWKKNNTKK